MTISRGGTWLLMALFCAVFWSVSIWGSYLLIEWMVSLIKHTRG